MIASSGEDGLQSSASLPLSIVLVSYNMKREIARTLHSLSGNYQRNVDSRTYEVIVVDNGSSEPPSLDEFRDLDINLRILHCPEPNPSPVLALNLGLA